MEHKLTKKQVAAMERIIAGEQAKINENAVAVLDADGKPIIAGAHPSGDRYAITDGFCMVVLDQSYGFPVAKREDGYDKRFRDAESKGDYWLVEAKIDPKELRDMIRSKKCSPENAPSVEVMGKTASDLTITGIFNAQYLLNIIEAVGTGAVVYIGYHDRVTKPYKSIMVYPKDWDRRGWNVAGFLLPRRE